MAINFSTLDITIRVVKDSFEMGFLALLLLKKILDQNSHFSGNGE